MNIVIEWLKQSGDKESATRQSWNDAFSIIKSVIELGGQVTSVGYAKDNQNDNGVQ